MNVSVRERGKDNDPLIILGVPVDDALMAISTFMVRMVTRTSTTVKAISRFDHAQGEAGILRACGPTSHFTICSDSAAIKTIETVFPSQTISL